MRLCFLTSNSLPCLRCISPLLLDGKCFTLCSSALCARPFSSSPYIYRKFPPSSRCTEEAAEACVSASFPLSFCSGIIFQVLPCGYSSWSSFPKLSQFPVFFSLSPTQELPLLLEKQRVLVTTKPPNWQCSQWKKHLCMQLVGGGRNVQLLRNGPFYVGHENRWSPGRANLLA